MRTTVPEQTAGAGLRRWARRAGAAAYQGVRTVAEAFATPLVPGDFLDLVSPLRRGADLRGRVLAVTPETRHATTVTIRPGRGWAGHRPGQYTRIGFEVDGVRHWRAYSITSLADAPDGTIAITIRAITDGVVSNHARTGLRAGDLVLLDQAAGDFVLPDPAPDKVLFLVAGSGVTPVIGMLRNHELGDVVVVHSAPTADAALFRDELQALADAERVRYVVRVTDEPGQAGRLDARDIGDVVPDWPERHTWACGPTSLLDDAEGFWAQQGLTDRLHTERFRTQLAVVGDGGPVSFERSGIEVDAGPASALLDVGEEAGVLMPSGCRMGICFNCVTPLTSGSVRDLRTGELTSASDIDHPLIQTCVSAAAGACQLAL